MKLLTQAVILASVSIALVGCGKNSLFGSSSAPIINGNQVADSGSQTYGVANATGFNGQDFGDSQAADTASMPTTVYYGFDKNTLSADAKQVADQNAEFLLKHPNTHAVIAGNTDPRGSQEYNFHLGQRRANALKTYLLSRGVASNQICTVSYGELKPAAAPSQFGGDWHKAYRLDRRAELQYNKSCEGTRKHA